MTTKRPGGEDPKINDFRAIIRSTAAEGGKTISSCLHGLLDDSTVVSKDGEKLLDSERFIAGITKIKEIKTKFSATDLRKIFTECDEGEQQYILVDELADFCSRTVSKARALSIKLRAAIVEEAKDESGYRAEFVAIAGKSKKYIELPAFIDYIDHMLDMHSNEQDASEILSLFDMDGDGKVSCDDFVGFILGQTLDAFKALKTGNGEAIVDIKICNSVALKADLTANEYAQITVDNSSNKNTFGKNESLWIWKRKQGTCAGRLKPIIDIQLFNSSISSAMVLSGYTCVSESVSGGQWMWLKRATTDEDEKDAIMDIRVTLGKAKNQTDTMHKGPGTGWIKVAGNFAKSTITDMMDFNHLDAFVWFLPARTRTIESHLMSPIRAATGLSDEVRVKTWHG